MSEQPSAGAILTDLVSAGVVLQLDGGKLRIVAPPGALTAERRAAIDKHRDELRRLAGRIWQPKERCTAFPPCRRSGACQRPTGPRPCFVDPYCCLCGDVLPEDRLYLCEVCTAESARRAHGLTDDAA